MASYFHASPMVCPLLPDRVSIGKLPRPRSIRGKFHRASALINFKFITCNYFLLSFYSHSATFALLIVIHSLLSFKGYACF